jgi:hypothetical protein
MARIQRTPATASLSRILRRRKSRTELNHTLMWYVANYGLPLNTVRRHRAFLDQPRKLFTRLLMAPWRNAQFGHTRPIHQGKFMKKKTKTKAPKANPTPTVAITHQLEQSLSTELRRLKGAAGKAHQRYTSEKDPLMAEVYLQQWLKISRDVANMVKVAPKADQEAGDSLKRSDMEQVWSRSIIEFRKTLESMSRRISTNPLFARLDPIDVEEVINKEVVAALTRLSAGSWLGKDEEKAA